MWQDQNIFKSEAIPVVPEEEIESDILIRMHIYQCIFRFYVEIQKHVMYDDL